MRLCFQNVPPFFPQYFLCGNGGHLGGIECQVPMEGFLKCWLVLRKTRIKPVSFFLECFNRMLCSMPNRRVWNSGGPLMKRRHLLHIQKDFSRSTPVCLIRLQDSHDSVSDHVLKTYANPIIMPPSSLAYVISSLLWLSCGLKQLLYCN